MKHTFCFVNFFGGGEGLLGGFIGRRTSLPVFRQMFCSVLARSQTARANTPPSRLDYYDYHYYSCCCCVHWHRWHLCPYDIGRAKWEKNRWLHWKPNAAPDFYELKHLNTVNAA